MDKAITTAPLVIAGVIASVALTNVVLPAVNKGSSAIVVSNKDVTERIKTSLTIISASGDITNTEVLVWAKNVGNQTVLSVKSSDIILTTPSEIKRITYNANCAAESPDCWSYAFQGGATDWSKTVTIKITVRLITLPVGEYNFLMVSANGSVTEKVFSV